MSLVWFLCLGGLGCFFPFYGLYLRENAGLSGTQVGLVFAMLPLAGMLAQPFWGNLADRTGARVKVLAGVALGAAAGQAVLFGAEGFPALLLATAAMAFFWTAVLPSSVAVTFVLVRDAGPNAFGLVRVWGTVGFLGVVVGFPAVLDLVQESRGLTPSASLSEPGLELMFPVAASLFLLGAGTALALPRRGVMAARSARGDWRLLLRSGPFVRVCLFSLVAFLCLRGPMAVFPIFVRHHGGTLDSVSQMWIPMILLEIPLVAASGPTLARLGPRGLVAAGILAGGLRWTLCAFAPDLRWIFAAQLLHGMVIAGLVLGVPLYVEAVVPERLRATGQGVTAFAISLGSVTSNLLAGWLLERFDPDAPYLAGGLAALTLGCLVPFILPAAEKTLERTTSARGAEAGRGASEEER